MASDASSTPRSVEGEAEFPHKQDLLAALNSGASLRRDERIIAADSHHGVYRMRLDLALEARSAKGHDARADRAAKDMEWFLRNLEADLSAATRSWFVRTRDGERFLLVEDEESGAPLGCLRYVVGEEGSK